MFGSGHLLFSLAYVNYLIPAGLLASLLASFPALDLLDELLVRERPSMLRVVFKLLLPEKQDKLSHRDFPDGFCWLEAQLACREQEESG